MKLPRPLLLFPSAALGRMAALSLCAVLQTLAAREIRFLAWDDDIARRPFSVVVGGEVHPVIGLHSLQRSRAVSIPDDPENPLIPFLFEGSEADLLSLPEGSAPPRLRLDIPDSLQRPLVILVPDSERPLGLKPLVLEDSTRGFDWGSFRILNTTRHQLVLITRDRRTEIPPDWEPVDLSLDSENNEPVVIAIEDPQRGFTVIYSSIWMPDSDSRRLVLIVPAENARLGYVALKIIPEFPEPEPPPTKEDQMNGESDDD